MGGLGLINIGFKEVKVVEHPLKSVIMALMLKLF